MITNGNIPRFPLLRSLTLRDTTTDVATTYISLLLGCTVSSLDIDIKATSTADQTTTLYTALTTYCSHSELYSLEIENNSQYSRDADIDFNVATYLVPITSLLMLRCFTNLATVCLQSPEGFELDDTTVESLARAWPRLTELILKADVVAMHHSNMTLAGLRAFAQHCPKLEFLYITFNAVLVEAPLLGEHPHARPVQRKLDRLQVGRSPIHTAGDVAAYLSGLFPVLEVVSPFGPVNNSDEEGEARWTIWRQVQDLLPVMHGLRAEEKAIASHRADAEGV
ncbi:hypothetical protein C8R43DRAFT_639985 [Mycena crocata]|nr:hypothetical protein C8R43DRAFT_639985 [Mycena crocata]